MTNSCLNQMWVLYKSINPPGPLKYLPKIENIYINTNKRINAFFVLLTYTIDISNIGILKTWGGEGKVKTKKGKKENKKYI